MNGMISSGIAAFVLGGAALALVSAAVSQAGSGADRMKEALAWKIVDGRYAEGPYKGYLAESPKRKDKVVWTDDQWKKTLTPEQYRILRGHGTERAFCGVFYDNHQEGTYKVAAIGFPVFKSDAKFDSGTGWPSFFQPYDKDAIWLKPDFSYGMVRMEVLDSKSDGHLGHVFTDGPSAKGGLRFCINSEVLEFTPSKKD